MTNEERFRQLLGETLPPKKAEEMTLECGHKLRVTRDEARRRQLFIGKRVIC